MRIEEALERFMTQLEADGRSIHTRRQYQRHVRLLARWARGVGGGGDEIERLGHEDVARFLAAPVATGRQGGGAKKATSANCLRSSVKVFLGYCHRAGYVPADPGRLIRRARCLPPPPRAISEADQRRLLGTLERAEGPGARRDHALFHLMLASGIRIGSALALDVEDVFLDKSEIQIRTAKGDAPDVVYLGDEIKRHLARYLADRAAGPLFTAKGHRVSQRHIQRRLGQWLKAADITSKVSCHSLRHGFAERIYAKSGDVLLVKEALRHRSIASTLVYTRLDVSRLRAAL